MSGICPRCKIRLRYKSAPYCHECKLEYNRAYMKKPKYRTYLKEFYAEPENRVKYLARSNAYTPIKYGRLSAQPCSECGSTEKTEMHHADYTKIYDIIWLCITCHSKVTTTERLMKQLKNAIQDAKETRNDRQRESGTQNVR